MATLFYDPDCGICTRSARFLHRRSVKASVVPLSQDALDRYGIDPDRAAREIPFIGDDGSLSYGSAGVAGALLTGGLGWRVIGALMLTPPISCLSSAIYRLIAGNRHRFPGSSCQLPR